MLEYKCPTCNEVRWRAEGNARITGSGILRCAVCGDDLLLGSESPYPALPDDEVVVHMTTAGRERAIKVVHQPTGLSVQMDVQGSMLKTRERAFKRLAKKVAASRGAG